MDPALVRDQLLGRLEPYRDRLGVLIFEFGQFHGGPMRSPGKFTEALGKLLAGLPLDRFRFSVEVRNREFLESPGRERYLACLRDHGTAHCFNSWTHMPPVIDQMQIPGVFTAPHVVARFLLRPGRAYQQAVDQFAPYDRIQDPYPEGRDALRDLIEACVAESRSLLAFVNNRFEGNAPQTIQYANGKAEPVGHFFSSAAGWLAALGVSGLMRTFVNCTVMGSSRCSCNEMIPARGLVASVSV